MKVFWSQWASVWTLRIVLEGEDRVRGGGQGSSEVTLLANEAHFILPRVIDEPHPDLLAMAAIVCTRPWIGKRLVMERGVTKEFSEVAQRLLGFRVEPVVDSLATRDVPSDAVPALSFSSGVDSIAASVLVPAGSPFVHYRRVDHPVLVNRSPGHRSDGIEDLARQAIARGYNLDIVRSDIEHLCHPYATMPHWLGIAVGVYLLADDLKTDAVAFGGTLETFFMDMGRRWIGAGGRGIEPLSEVVGVPFYKPLLGVTEIGTMKIAMDTDLADLARSCVLGTREEPCGVCAKCVRKGLTQAALSGDRRLPQGLGALSADAPGIKSMSGPTPLYMQAQLEFALARLDLPAGPLREIYDRIGSPRPEITQWMLRAYSPGIVAGVPAKYRALAAKNLSQHLAAMTEEDIEAATSWER